MGAAIVYDRPLFRQNYRIWLPVLVSADSFPGQTNTSAGRLDWDSEKWLLCCYRLRDCETINLSNIRKFRSWTVCHTYVEWLILESPIQTDGADASSVLAFISLVGVFHGGSLLPTSATTWRNSRSIFHAHLIHFHPHGLGDLRFRAKTVMRTALLSIL